MTISIREARREDVHQLAALEETVWGPLETCVYTREHFETWIEINPRCLLVAEEHGTVCAYVYGQIVDVLFRDRARFMTTCDEITDQGFTRETHDPRGNCLYGMSIVSLRPGAGRPLINALYDVQIKRIHEYKRQLMNALHALILSQELQDNPASRKISAL